MQRVLNARQAELGFIMHITGGDLLQYNKLLESPCVDYVRKVGIFAKSEQTRTK
jgi:hypothetical protein